MDKQQENMKLYVDFYRLGFQDGVVAAESKNKDVVKQSNNKEIDKACKKYFKKRFQKTVGKRVKARYAGK